METISRLPESRGIIGARTIAKAVHDGKVRHVVVASNCPDFLIEKLGKVRVEKFEGNQRELGTKLGKPFAVAMVGYSGD